MSFQKTASFAVFFLLTSFAVFLKTAVAVVPKLTTAFAVITYNFNITKNLRKFEKIVCIK